MTVLAQLQSALGDRFDFERELGGGGMSQVFLATERDLARRVVVKVLPPELGQSVNLERFRLEVATLATLQHPQIVPVYSAGVADGLLYYVMPFVAGESLRARMDREGPLATDDVIRLIAPLARALAYAHREGIVHRDIKPENVLLAQGEPVLADFGIAKVLRDGAAHGTLTSAGMSLGTVTYMAPEQVLAEPTMDGRADVYSLAALAWELLAGRPPFEGSAQQVMSAHVVKPLPDLRASAPSVPDAVCDVLVRALAKDPAERYTADEFAAALDAAGRAQGSNVAPGAAPRAVPSGAPTTSATSGAVSTSRSGTLAAGALVLVAIVAGGVWWMRRDATVSSSLASATASPSNTPAERPGIAVLPFQHIGASNDAYLAAGMTDELMTQLAEVSGLRVASSTTVRAYSDSTLTPAELGARLRVRALVEGSVQRANNQLRVTTRLVDVRDGSTLWSNRYERTTEDLFAVQRDIGAAVVRSLTERIGLVGSTASTDQRTTDPVAYDLFLRGRFALQQRGADSLRAAIARFREAIARDSSFARAWAGIAEATALLPVYGAGGFDVYGPQVRDAAERAIELDSALGAPHFALGIVAKGTGDWRRAEREFDLALTRQPDLGATHQNRAELLYTVGRVDDAVQAMARAAQLEPQDVPIVSQFAGTLVIGGQLDSARRVLDRALSRDPNMAFAYWSKMMLNEREGDERGALQAISKASTLAPLPFFTGLTVRAARRAQDAQAERRAQAAIGALGSAPGAALARALADIEVAPLDSSFARLNQAITERDPFMWQIPLRLWWFDRLRGDPRFGEIAKRLQLPPMAIEPLPPLRR
ncbi:MAG: protein kinase [Gemmatimonadaceae bacterium]|nr:protein kinase [Gemmatimonadaceae bacterium]